MKLEIKMLLQISIIAVVGGALAFKANRFHAVYCIRTIDPIENPNKLCDATIEFLKPGFLPAPRYYYTTRNLNGLPIGSVDDCPHIECPSTTLTIE